MSHNNTSLCDHFLGALQCPDAAFLGKKVAKKILMDNASLSSTDKALVRDVLKSIEWRYSFKPDTVKIPSFEDGIHEYEEVAILCVAVKSKVKTKQVCRLLHQHIPYPLLLIVSHENAIALSVADKRISQADNSQLMIEHQYDTGWLEGEITPIQQAFFDDMAFASMATTSLYDFYLDWITKFNRFDAAKFTGRYGSEAETTSENPLSQLLVDLKALEAELHSLRQRLKKTTQMNEKVRLNVQARTLKQQIAEITTQL